MRLARWGGNPWEASTIDAANRWSTATGGKLNVDVIPFENLHEQEVLQLSSGSGADIMYVLPGWLGEYVSAGYLRAIDDFQQDSSLNPQGFSPTQYDPASLALGKYNGKQYCLPDFIGNVAIGYRKSVFQKYGIAAPKEWADVLAAASQLNGKDGMAGLAIPGKKTDAPIIVLSGFMSTLGTWWVDDQNKPAVDESKLAQAFQMYAEAAKYAPEGVLNHHWDEADTLAGQGKAAMVVTITQGTSWLLDPSRSSTPEDWAFVNLSNAGHPGGVLINWNWCISSKSANPKAAYSFLQWFTSGPEQVKVAKTGYTAGPTKDFYTDQNLQRQLPFLPALLNSLTFSKPQPTVKEWPQLQDQVAESVQNVIQGKTTPQQAAKDTSANVVKLLGH